MTTSAYPVIWALKHAPVADAYERAVLLALADSGDPDGCDCYPSPETMTVIAKCDAQTVKERCKAMQKRGLIRRQRQAPSKPGWLRIPRNRRPAVWELMIPSSWWSDEQRAGINRMRAERGANTEPITPETRPDLTPAPQRAPRADKGRTRATVQPNEEHQSLWGVSQTPQDDPVENRPGGSVRPGLGGLTDPAWGVYKTPNPPGGPSCMDLPEETSVRTSYSLRSPDAREAAETDPPAYTGSEAETEDLSTDTDLTPQGGSVVEDTAPETDANGHQPSAQPANENHPLDVPSGYTHRPSAQPTNDLPTLDEPTVADRPPKNTNSPNTNSPNPERAREHDPTPAVTTGSETDAETDTQSEASGAAPVAEPETDGDESDTAGQARRLAANVDWAAEVGAWKSQYGEIRAAVAAALNRGVPPAMLGAYLPMLASQARTVHYVLTGLSPDRLPTGATPASLGLASDGNTGRAPACLTHPDALPRTRYDGTRRCPHCHPPTQQPPNTPTYVHDLLTALRTKKDWHDPTTDRQAEATGTHSGPQPALTRSPGGRQPGESIDDYRGRISEQLWQLDHDTRDAGSAGEPKAAA